VILKGVHGKVGFAVQRLIESESGKRCTYFELSGQLTDGYMSAGLQELAAYYSNRLSYQEVEGLLRRFSGQGVLSDQRIEQVVIDKAAEVSQGWATQAAGAKLIAEPVPITPVIDLYDDEVPEVRLFEDGIGVKAQKDWRAHQGSEPAVKTTAVGAKRILTDVVMLECRDGRYRYLCEGIDPRGRTVLTLEDHVRRALREEYADHPGPLNVVAISDGASAIRQSLHTIFDITPVVVLDWYHLCKKTAELMSMVAMNKTDKERHLSVMLKRLWAGEVESVLSYLRTEVVVRNADKHQELLGYLEKHRHEIIDYAARQAVGKPIGSGRMEKGVDHVVGHRQKKKGMAWSAKGSKALAILKVVELNGQWQQLWFPRQQPLKAAA
jgi:hypothetical protein